MGKHDEEEEKVKDPPLTTQDKSKAKKHYEKTAKELAEEEDGNMRDIIWKPGTRAVTRERASAIAWATRHSNRKAWTEGYDKVDVIEQIAHYLEQHGYKPAVSRGRGWLSGTIKTLVKQNFAYVQTEELPNGRTTRVVEFGFLPDVSLDGHQLPESASIEAKASVAQYQRWNTRPTNNNELLSVIEEEPSAVQTATDRPVEQPEGRMPPIPGLSKPRRPYAEELGDLLDTWHEKAPVAYTKWAATVVEDLRAGL